MGANCVRCQSPAEAGLRCGLGVLCPDCATRHEQAGTPPTGSRGLLRAIQSRQRARSTETASDYVARREFGLVVDAREDFARRIESVDGEIGWLKFKVALMLLTTVPAIFYVRFHDYLGLSQYLAGMLIANVLGRLLELFGSTGKRRALVVEELEGVGAYLRYRRLREDLKHVDPTKQRLVRRQILPKLKKMMEEKLPYLMQRRFEFASFLRAYRAADLQAEVDSLSKKLSEEPDTEVRDAMSKRFSLARARLDHYTTLERRMRLYQIHLGNLESHMENLVARVVMLDPNEDMRDATESIMRGLNEEVEVLEDAYRETAPAH